MRPLWKIAIAALCLRAMISAASAQTVSVPNNAQSGTQLNRLAILTTGGTARVLLTSDTTFLGIVTAGAGFGGNATIAQTGQAACQFDGPAGGLDYAIISTTIGGMCHDTGSQTNPGGTNVVGQVISQNANGTFNVILAVSSGGSSSGGGCTSPVQYTASTISGITISGCGIALTGSTALSSQPNIYLPLLSSVGSGTTETITDQVTAAGGGLSATDYLVLNVAAGDTATLQGPSTPSGANMNLASGNGTWVLQAGATRWNVIQQPGVTSVSLGACVNQTAATITTTGSVVGALTQVVESSITSPLTGASWGTNIIYTGTGQSLTSQAPSANQCPTEIDNQGSGGITFTPSSGTVNGAANITISTSWGFSYTSNGTNLSGHWVGVGTAHP